MKIALPKNRMTTIIKKLMRFDKKIIYLSKKLFLFLYLKYSELTNLAYQKDSIAIFTVFILRENILFLEEWIEHHINMGVDHFVLYDNSKVELKDKVYENFEAFKSGKINKYGIDYSELISEEKAQSMMIDIQNKYPGKITVNLWKMKDIHGKIGYFQVEAVRDFVQKYKNIFEYCLHIDMDEFMINREDFNLKDIIKFMKSKNITSLFFKQKFFENRFDNLDKQVREITKCLNGDRNSTEKTMFKLQAAPIKNVKIHFTYTYKNNYCDSDKMVDYHYRFCFNPGDYNYDHLKINTGEDYITNNTDALKYIV